ncbi:MAG TPA: pyruvate dehydrogenase complex dihydrolipoamide acetyltransferase [Opitutaceae bacterium]|nr:pyruvate dehydrogenase complex dihydrolipoamide acetyltransferase [Opitutaceae bacterium]
MAQIIEMPKLSDTMTVGTLVKWLKNEGDTVKSGDMLAEVETDKATMELESFFDGVLLKQFAAAGSSVAIGEALAAIGKAGEKVEAPAPKKAEAPKAEEKKPETKEPEKKEEPKPASAVQAPAAAIPHSATPNPQSPASGRLRISPLALRLAAELGVDPKTAKGSGPGGRILRADILAAAKNPPAKAAAPAGKAAPVWPWRSVTDKSAVQAEATASPSNMRATIARRLLESKTQIPHVYLEIEVDADPLMALREQLNAGLAKDKVKLSVNDFVLKASAAALRAVPSVNTSWEEKGIKSHGAVHVSFAVAIDDGLITPVIRNTDQKSLMQISAETKELGKKAKDRKLTPAEFTGGTFCVSNLGMMGIERFTAIINPPNAAILAVGATVKKPVVVDDEIVIGQRMSLTLSCDHRIVDGAVGAKFLNALRDHLQNPALLLL